MMTMAEKQYKNYDERFLKEDTSSGSRPVIEYDITNENEVIIMGEQGTQQFALKAKFQDGTYATSKEELYEWFKNGFICTLFSSESSIISYAPVLYASDSSTSAYILGYTGATPPVAIVDATTFDQYKPSQS